MIVKLIQTGEVKEVEDSFGLRLIEQGRAVTAPAVVREEPFPMNEPENAAKEPAPAKQETKKTKKG